MTKPTLYLNFSPNPSGRTGRPAVQPLLPRPRMPRALKAEVPFTSSGTSAHDPTGTAEGPNLADPLVRQSLPMRNAPHYLKVRPGVYLGYRVGKRQRSWVVRFQDPREKGLDYSMVLGVAPESEKKRRHLERMDYTQALGAALTLVQRLERHAPGLEIRATSVTVDEAMDHYVAWKRAEGSTRIMELEQQIARHIHPTLGAIPLDQLSKQQVAQWTQGMAGTPKAVRARAGTLGFAAFPTTKAGQDARRATANRVFSILRAGLNYACDYLELEIPREAWKGQRGTTFSKADKAREAFATPEEQRLLVGHCGPGLRELVVGALLTGCRFGELSQMRVADYHRRTGTIHIPKEHAKTDESRKILLTPIGNQFFDRHTHGRGRDELMFMKANGEAWGPSSYQREFKLAVKKTWEQILELERVSGEREDTYFGHGFVFHCLRHSYAATLLTAGVSELVVMRQLGHSSLRMIEEHYWHVPRGAQVMQLNGVVMQAGLV